MAKRAKELGQPSIAITDHGTMYGATSSGAGGSPGWFFMCKDGGYTWTQEPDWVKGGGGSGHVSLQSVLLGQ